MTKNTKPERPYGIWNWGTGILIAIIISVAAMSFLVYKSTQVTYEMSEKDYYAAELQFDKTLMAERNANALSKRVTIQQKNDYITILFPAECKEKTSDGTILMYRPSSEKEDIAIPFELKDTAEINISKNEFIKGIYIMKASWKMNGKPYCVTEQFFIDKP
ncbi:MAG: FixH family protein [Bacteroidetes bacterium]|nr:FixH family protein [Bacteroidota bacterium]